MDDREVFKAGEGVVSTSIVAYDNSKPCPKPTKTQRTTKEPTKLYLQEFSRTGKSSQAR
jgi:hypothetical protein